MSIHSIENHIDKGEMWTEDKTPQELYNELIDIRIEVFEEVTDDTTEQQQNCPW